jgi:hypothetical protein
MGNGPALLKFSLQSEEAPILSRTNGLARSRIETGKLISPGNAFLSIKSFLPLASTDSYMDTRLRCEPRWLACFNSCDHSAVGSKSRRLRRPMRRTFALKRYLNRPKATRLVRPPLNRGKSAAVARPRGRWDERACLRAVEVEHALETLQNLPPQAGTFSLLAKGRFERQQAQPTSPASDVNLSYTSQLTRAARTTSTIKMDLFFCPTGIRERGKMA